jgi:predicted phosphoribosyltransferase
MKRSIIVEIRPLLRERLLTLRKTILNVDDGAAKCFTIIAGARSVRKNINRKRLVIALSISAKRTINTLKK